MVRMSIFTIDEDRQDENDEEEDEFEDEEEDLRF